MFFGSNACHRLEPVRKMSGSIFHGPFLHCDRNGVSHIQFQMAACLDCFPEGLVDISREFVFHDFVVEYKTSIKLGNTFFHNRVSFQIQCRAEPLTALQLNEKKALRLYRSAFAFLISVVYINKTECQYFPSMFFKKTQNIRRRSDWSVFSTYPDLLNRH